MWISGEKSFKSFKTELGWSGGKYSDGKLLIFTVTDTLNPGESVKFGLTTNQKVFAINWKALDQNEQSIDTRKTHIQEIDPTTSSFAEEESKAIEEIKEDHNEGLELEGIVVNQFQSQANLPKQLIEDLRAEKLPVFDTFLNASVKMKESRSQQMPLIHMAKSHRLTQQFVELHNSLGK